MPKQRRFVPFPALLGYAVLLAPTAIGQIAERSSDGYIERTFEATIGEKPRMGWFVPRHGFVARERTATEVHLLAAIGAPAAGRRQYAIPSIDVARLRKENGVACETTDTEQFTAFAVGSELETERALYFTRPMKGQARRGLVTIQLTGVQIERIDRVLGWPNRNTLRRDEAIGVGTGSAFYSLHKLYDPISGLLRQEAIVLHRKDGSVLAHTMTRGIDSEQGCDGCGTPRYALAASGLYRPLNLFELPGFAYPVLLLDSSTFEGRGLTLFTFTPDHTPATFRISEYVMHCD